MQLKVIFGLACKPDLQKRDPKPLLLLRVPHCSVTLLLKPLRSLLAMAHLLQNALVYLGERRNHLPKIIVRYQE